MVKRDVVFGKFNGVCAYTGKPLESDWQVDHMTPKESWIWSNKPLAFKLYGIDYEMNDIENLMPTCRIVNHYKRCLDLDGFRKYMLEFHIRISKLPKVPKVTKSKKRKEYMLKVAELFDITPNKPFAGKFYFELI